MMGQGKGGSSEDDKEHKSSDLLHGQHLDEWIETGEQVLPAFGVIGGQVTSAEAFQDDSSKQERRSGQQKPPQVPRPGRVQGEYR
jgi:hypothetical protein